MAFIACLLVCFPFAWAVAAEKAEEAQADAEDPDVIAVENLISKDMQSTRPEKDQVSDQAWKFTEADPMLGRKKRLSPKKSPGNNDSLKISLESNGGKNAESPPEEIYDTKIRMLQVGPRPAPAKVRDMPKSATAKDQNFKIVLTKIAPPPSPPKGPAPSRAPASVKVKKHRRNHDQG